MKGCNEEQIDLPLDTTDHVAIKSATFEETKSEGTPGLDHTTAIREHLNTANFKHGAIFGQGRAGTGLGGHDHTEARRWRFQAAAKHEAISDGMRNEGGKKRKGDYLGSKKCRRVGIPGKLS